MEKLFQKIKQNKCPICDGELYLYDMYNNTITYYGYMLENNDFSRISHRKLSHFKCNKCNTCFPIKWDNETRTIPTPLSEIGWNDFMRWYDKK